MFRTIISALILTASGAVAQDLSVSQSIADTGLSATEASLANATDPNDRLALGAVRFLRGIEATLQLRYRHNAVLDDVGIPVLRLPVPPNPEAQPFYPGLITDLFRGVTTDMDATRAALEGLDGDIALSLDLAHLWFDINGNGARDAGEGLFTVTGDALSQRPADDGFANLPPSLIVRFDTADVAWLRAYTHLLSGISDLVIAFDPTEVITEVMASIPKMQAISGRNPPDRYSYLRGNEPWIDMAAMFYGAINRVPDATLTRSARQHLLAVVAENRAFWRQVAQETDDNAEWIPNATQHAALGFELPPDTGTMWLNVLGDAESVLNGELLVGHWRTEPGGGINVAKLMENPVAVDIVTWIHGHGLQGVMERGPLVSDRNLSMFEQMFEGDAMLFMVMLN